MFLGIFTGIEILFFMLGVMVTLTVGALVWLRMNRGVALSSIAILACGLFTMIMAIAWSVSCVLEGEPQAGSMGMIVMFIPGLVMASFGVRHSKLFG